MSRAFSRTASAVAETGTRAASRVENLSKLRTTVTGENNAARLIRLQTGAPIEDIKKYKFLNELPDDIDKVQYISRIKALEPTLPDNEILKIQKMSLKEIDNYLDNITKKNVTFVEGTSPEQIDNALDLTGLTQQQKKQIQDFLNKQQPLPTSGVEPSKLEKFKKAGIKSKDKAIEWAKANKVTAATLVFVVTASTIALIRTQQINSTEFRITSIRQDPKDSRYIEIRYNDSIKFTVGTTVNILSSNSLPSVNGSHEMIKTESGKFSIEAGTITSPGDYGTFTCSTSYEKELGKAVDDLTIKPLTEFTKGFLSDYTESFNKMIEKIFSYWWVVLISSIFVVLLVVLMIFIRQ